MKKIRVLIVDDSSFMRMAIRGFLSHDPEIEVAGVASDGSDAVAKAALLRPDIITMDVEMPVMDGISAVRKIMATTPTRIIMVSTLTSSGATASFEALEAGAIDYIPKNTSDAPGGQDQFRAELLRKIKDAAHASIATGPAKTPAPHGGIVIERKVSVTSTKRVKYIGIGASTGGPPAVQDVLSRLPAGFPHAIMVAIHMPQAFTGPYAERLNANCRLPVREAADGDILKAGEVLIAPGGRHLTLVRRPQGITVRISPTSDYKSHFYVPSVDLMMCSLVEAADGPVLGVVLTGMGNDGLKGMQLLKSKGGITIVQDKSTSTIYGMPRACVEGGVADEILPLEMIGPAIAQMKGA